MNIQVGVKLIIEKDGKILLLRRTQDSTKHMWDIPGGRINAGESLTDALAREVAEETGMHITGATTLLAAQDIMVSAKDIHVVRLTYSGTVTGEVRLSAEHDSFQWVDKPLFAAVDGLDPYVVEVAENFL